MLLLVRLTAAVPLQSCEEDAAEADFVSPSSSGSGGGSIYGRIASSLFRSIGLPELADFLHQPPPVAPTPRPSPPVPVPAPASPPPEHPKVAQPPAAFATAAGAGSSSSSGVASELPDVSWTPEVWSGLPPQPMAVSVDEPARQRRVRAAFAHAWSGYRKHAWGADELDAGLQLGVHSYGMGLTLVDSLDSLMLMGTEAEIAEALEWIDGRLRFGAQEEINVFEVTIRVLGGLLAAYEATGHAPLLAKADELGGMLLFAFHTLHGLPYGTVGLKTKTRYNPKWSRGASTIAEVATLQLEFKALSRHTGNPAYDLVAQRVADHLRTMPQKGEAFWPADLPRGLYPMFISVETGKFSSNDITLGARADSLYEYLLKQWLFSGRTDTRMRAMYDESVAAIKTHLVRRGGARRCGNCTYIASWNHRTKVYREEMDHLVCFVPGMLALGADGATRDDDMTLARELMSTCVQMYTHSPSGLAPEIADFSHASKVRANNGARHCLLRPETVESLLIMWRLTGDAIYREWGWQIFEAIETHAKVATGGFASVKDVTAKQLTRNGHMESFFTAETLKYLYLLFGDGTAYPLDQYVFNTEAHPLRIHAEYRYGARWGSLPALGDLDAADAASASRNATARAAAVQDHARMRELVQARTALLARLPVGVAS